MKTSKNEETETRYKLIAIPLLVGALITNITLSYLIYEERDFFWEMILLLQFAAVAVSLVAFFASWQLKDSYPVLSWLLLIFYGVGSTGIIYGLIIEYSTFTSYPFG